MGGVGGRELVVRRERELAWWRIRASTWAAPGVRTSPVHTHPSRSKTRPRISRRVRRVGLMVAVGYYHAGPKPGGWPPGPALSTLGARGRARSIWDTMSRGRTNT